MPVAPDIPAAEMAIVEMTNTFRKEHKLAGATPSPLLAAAARAYAKVLAARQAALSHTVDGTTPAQRAQSAGYAPCQIAENLAMLYDSRGFTAMDYARRTLAGWKDSPGHRGNMLMPHVTEIGVGIARMGPNDPRYVAVQLFARPEALKYSFRIANKTPGTLSYAFAGEEHAVKSRQIITHTSCAPGTIAFKLDAGGTAAGRHEARDGQIYTLISDGNGGVRVEVKGGAGAD
jgi:hypothetical protein